MKQIKIKITPVDKFNKQDKKKAELLQKLLLRDTKKYEGVVSWIVKAQMQIDLCYGIKMPPGFWDSLLKEVVKIEMNNILEKK